MRVAAYARVSSQKQKEEETINSQIDQLQRYAQEKGYNIVKLYTDDGYSGELLNRPALDSLRDDAVKKMFDRVIIIAPDRLARKYIYQEIVRDELKKHNVEIEFLNRNIGETPEDRMLLGVQGIFADYEKEKFMERTRRGKLYKAKNGSLLGGVPPYGYRYNDKTRCERSSYSIVEEEAKVVRLIFDLYVNKGLALRSVVRELGKQGIKPRSGKAFWGRSSIAKILNNETYFGTTYYNKNMSVEPKKQKDGNGYRRHKRTGRILRDRRDWIPISVPAIIEDKMILESAQQIMEKNIAFSLRNTKNHYLLRGLLKCACGAPMVGTPCHGKLYYRCGQRYQKFPEKQDCSFGSISASKLEQTVWAAFCRVVEDPEIVKGQVKKYYQRDSRDSVLVQKELSEIESRLATLKSKENSILDIFLEGSFQRDVLNAKLNSLREEEAKLLQRKQTLNQQLMKQPIEDMEHRISEGLEKVSQRLKQVSDNFDCKQELIRLLFDKIQVSGQKLTISGIIPISLSGNTMSITSSRHGHSVIDNPPFGNTTSTTSL